MTEENKDESQEDTASAAPENESASTGSTNEGVQWQEMNDPLAGVKKTAGNVMDSMEGKTVSMKTYVGSIIGVILLMMLARCGG